MAITRTQWVDDDGTGTTGTVINNAEKTLLYDQIDAAIISAVGGIWTDIGYAAGDFTASPSGTWTTSAPTTYAYQLSGKTLILALYGLNWTIGGAPVYLEVKIPGGRTAARILGGSCIAMQAGSAVVPWWFTSGNLLKVARDQVGTPWAPGNMYLHGTFILNVA